MWVDFHGQFSQKNVHAIFQIQKSIAMEPYFTKLEALWDELEVHCTIFKHNQRQIHVDQREEDKLMQLFMGLK